ncbi:DUF488 family protein [Streptomyces sp. MUM 203J]|uniref:DUF488 domain-containing protein n=1 Tax=Streptomyces sp. MUM 203J TaxID=2791990 RepID=UPI001F03A421|nr:DUF488 family protein [Streptomyces sp. MUM 203J]MCH0539656.1 DUF488 family protein [Streptomyces sp. MUM 203J]
MSRTAHPHPVRVRRVYDPPHPDDGTRVLVDRLWPRGLAKADAHIDEWPKSLTPSTELRRWYHGAEDPGDAVFAEFRDRYEAELAAPAAGEALDQLRTLARRGPVTLLTSSRSPDRSHASILRELLAGG